MPPPLPPPVVGLVAGLPLSVGAGLLDEVVSGLPTVDEEDEVGGEEEEEMLRDIVAQRTDFKVGVEAVDETISRIGIVGRGETASRFSKKNI
jgi:hypothetical protein